jgi:hypothetical protein
VIARALLHSRLVHFVAGIALLFAVVPRPADARRIDVFSADVVAARAAGAGRARPRGFAGTKLDASEAEARAIEDELLYREALRLGLDRADGTVRQHLVTKALLFAEDVGGAARTPGEDELRAYFAAHRDRYTMHPQVHLLHVFSARAEAMNALRAEVLTADARSPSTPPPVGDAFPSVRDVTSTQEGLESILGDEFARAAFAQPVGSWGPPVASKLGWHFVKVLSREEGRPAGCTWRRRRRRASPGAWCWWRSTSVAACGPIRARRAPGASPAWPSRSTDAAGNVQTSLIKATPTSATTSCTRWQDPSYVASKPSYYYARVLQAPSPRWSHFDCLAEPTTAGSVDAAIDATSDGATTLTPSNHDGGGGDAGGDTTIDSGTAEGGPRTDGGAPDGAIADAGDAGFFDASTFPPGLTACADCYADVCEPQAAACQADVYCEDLFVCSVSSGCIQSGADPTTCITSCGEDAGLTTKEIAEASKLLAAVAPACTSCTAQCPKPDAAAPPGG